MIDRVSDKWSTLFDLNVGDIIHLEDGIDTVVTKEKMGSHAVADICVPGPHSYLLDNGIISHNSLMACQLAINQAQMGYKVVIVPLEMTKDEMTARLIANVNKIDVTRILTGKLSKAEMDSCFARYKRWVKHIKKKGGRLTIYKPEADVTIEDVFAAINSYDADVRIIDYISLLKGADNDDSWQALGAIARVAKINAGSSNAVNVLLCQVNDEGKIRYARAISEHSNNSWIWVAKKEEREKEIGRIKIEQPKARNSASYPFEVGFNWAYMKVVAVTSMPDTSEEADHAPMSNLADV